MFGGLVLYLYIIFKFIIFGMVKLVVSEFCEYGVCINCILLGMVVMLFVFCYFWKVFFMVMEEKFWEIVKGMSELKGVECEEVDVVKVVLFLVFEDGKYVIGYNLVVDGGMIVFKIVGFFFFFDL